MKKLFVFPCLFIALFGILAGRTEIFELNTSKAFDLGKLLESKNAIVGFAMDIDMDGDFLYILHGQPHILKIDIRSGELLKIISTQGQGPGELNAPEAIRVRGDNVYAADRGSGAVKVFDKNDGRFIKEIKISASIDDLDIAGNGHLILKKVDPTRDSLICEYDQSGQRVGTRAKETTKDKDGTDYLKDTYVRFRSDPEGNLYVLFPMKRMLVKYAGSGEVVWKAKVENEVLKKAASTEDSIKVNGKAINYTYNVFDLVLDPHGNILVGHNGGGQLFSKDGKTLAVFLGYNLNHFTYWNGNIVSILPKGNAYIYDLKSIMK